MSITAYNRQAVSCLSIGAHRHASRTDGPTVGTGRRPRGAELRISDAEVTWHVMYRLDGDAVIIVAVFAKRTQATHRAILETCTTRRELYDLHTRGGKDLCERQNSRPCKRTAGVLVRPPTSRTHARRSGGRRAEAPAQRCAARPTHQAPPLAGGGGGGGAPRLQSVAGR